MADNFGNPMGGTPSETPANNEFERPSAPSTELADGGGPLSLREKIAEDIGSVTDKVTEVTHTATEKAAEMADEQKSYAADQIGKLAGALERVGEELRSDNASAIGGRATHLGTSARQLADKVKNKNVSEIAGIAEDFGRRNPLAFLGIAAVAGLAASRFLIASKSTTSPNAATASTDQRETDNG